MGWFAIYPSPSQFQGVLQDSRLVLLLNPKVQNQTYILLFPGTCISGPENEGNAYWWNSFFKLSVFFHSCLCMRMKRNLMFLESSSCCFEHNMTKIHSTVYFLFVFEKLWHHKLPLYLSFCLIKTFQQLTGKGNILTGASESLIAKNYLSGFCPQQLKPRSSPCHWI